MTKPREMIISDAVSLIQSGEKLVLGHAGITPACLVEELVRQRDRLRDISIFQLIYLANPVHLGVECAESFRVVTPFMMGKEIRAAVDEHRADYLPMHFSYVPSIFLPGGGYETPDWTLLQVVGPDADGNYSCSLSSDFTLPAARASKHIMAIVNPQLPFIGGDNLIRGSEIDVIVHHSSLPYNLPLSRPEESDTEIARLCATLIEDGSTLQMGIGAIPDAVLDQLTEHKDLGIHTELFSDGVMRLHKAGVITGKKKEIHPGKIVGSFVMGSDELYAYLDKNSEVELYPVDYVNNPYIIGKHSKFVSINSCIEVDLYGQVCAEKVNGKMFSGSGGQLDYLRGVRYSEGGKSILALRSTAKGGELSRIVPNLHPQAVVTSPRNDVDYVVTEYGIAHLYGHTEADRARQLISVAHPDFREDLEREAHQRFGLGKVY